MFNVLYVDDETSLLELGKLFLEDSQEFKVTISSSAKEVLNKEDIACYDAIISDYQMPEINGIEFLKVVRSKSVDIPFILFTGKGREEIVIEAIDNGADFYLQKGGEPESQFAELMHKIRMAVDRRRAKEQIVFQNRLYSVLSATNRAIAYIRDKKELFSEICRILVEIGGFKAVWIGLADTNSKKIVRVASIGDVREYVADPNIEPWHETELRDGHLANATFPFAPGTRDSGIISVYSPKKGFFDEQILTLLEEMSRDISFALVTIEKEEQRISAESALRESEERLSLALNVAQMGTWDLDLVGHTAWRSLRHDQIFGYKTLLPEWTYEMFLEHVVPEDREFVNKAFNEAQTDRHDWEFECRIQRTDGEIRWIWARGRIQFGTSGELSRMLGLVQDITELKQAEEERQHLANIVEFSEDAITGKTLEGIIVSWNTGAERLYGYTVHEVIGKSVSILIPAREKDELQNILEKIKQKELINHFETKRVRKDGKIIDVSLTISPIKNALGDITGASTIARDITKRKQIEEELRKSDKRFHILFESVPIGIGISSLEGKVLDINPMMEQITGYNLPEFKVINLIDTYVNPDDRTRIVRKLQDNGEIKNYRVILKKKDGTLYFALLNSKIIEIDKEKVVLTTTIDTTEQSRLERALQESEERLSLALKSSGMGIFDWDIRNNKRIWDDQVHRLLGIKPGTFAGTEEEFFEILHPDDRPTVREVFKKSIVQKTPYEIEGRVVWPDASVHTIAVRGMVHYDNNDIAGRISGICWDITEQKKMDLELIESKKIAEESLALFRTLNENAPVGFAFMDTNYRFVQINSTLAEINGKSVNDHIGRTLEEVVPEIWSTVKPIYEQIIKTGKPVLNIEISGMTPAFPDIIKYWIGNYYPVKTNNDQIIGIGVIVIDITERKRAETDLKESERLLQGSEERFRHISETITDFAYSCRNTPNGGPFRIDWLTGAIEFITGYNENEILNMNCWGQLMIDDDFPLFESKVVGLSPGEIGTSELRIRRKDGEIVWIQSCTECVADPKNAEVLILYGGCQDITLRKRAEEAIMQANRQLKLMTTITRHDILNNVSVIRGYLSLANKKFTDNEIIEFCRKMELATDAIELQIEFTRVYQNLGLYEPQWQEIYKIVSTLLIPEKITLYSDMSTVQVYADPMLENVFLNLLDNSIRHAEGITEIRIISREKEEGLTIVWEDNGGGIPYNEKERIFERGFGKNTGLGLFLIKEILSITGIGIKETGEPGKGARFEIAVPKGIYRP